MQFTGKVNESDLSDVVRMTRSKMYWFKLLLANWYGAGIILAITWVTVAGFLGQEKPNWRALGVVWIVIAGIIMWSVFDTKRKQVRELAKLNATLADQIVLTSDGVKLNGPDGASAFLPWRNFKSWREGKRAMLLGQAQENQFVILPIGELSEIQREPVRQFLRSHIAPPTN
jgi:hypothetical protein